MPNLGLVIYWCHTGDEPRYLPEEMSREGGSPQGNEQIKDKDVHQSLWLDYTWSKEQTRLGGKTGFHVYLFIPC